MRSFGVSACLATVILAIGICPAAASSTDTSSYQVEWVYRIRYGHQDEWWKIFQRYQIAILDREKQLGYVTNYIVERPSLHTSEDSRWDFRVVINYPNYDASKHESEVERSLFTDRTTLSREEQQRWELTLNHWDLPIHEIDPHKVEN